MIRFLAILLSQLVLLQSLNIGINDITKIGVLIEHAQYHQEKYGDSFIEFLIEHYGDQEFSENLNHKEHQDLPFKQNTSHFNHLASILVINFEKIELKIPKKSLSKSTYFYQESFTNFEKSNIFQPPKIV